MLRALDDFLIDRVFQRLADRLEGHATCFDLARTAAAGMLVARTALNAIRIASGTWSGGWISASMAVDILFCAATLFWTRTAEREARRTGEGAMNPMRAALVWFRLVPLPLPLVTALALALHVLAGVPLPHGGLGPLYVAFDAANDLLTIAAVYWLCCGPSPPKARRAEDRGGVWRAAVAGAGAGRR